MISRFDKSIVLRILSDEDSQTEVDKDCALTGINAPFQYAYMRYISGPQPFLLGQKLHNGLGRCSHLRQNSYLIFFNHVISLI